NGQREGCAGALVERWRLMGTKRISDAIGEIRNERTGAFAKSGWRRSYIPFLDDDFGDYLCLDTECRPAPVCEFRLGERTPSRMSCSLTTWLEEMVAALQKGEFVEDLERGTMLRCQR